jgi:hypothetical protein
MSRTWSAISTRLPQLWLRKSSLCGKVTKVKYIQASPVRSGSTEIVMTKQTDVGEIIVGQKADESGTSGCLKSMDDRPVAQNVSHKRYGKIVGR